jgi:hypothetical protein
MVVVAIRPSPDSLAPNTTILQRVQRAGSFVEDGCASASVAEEITWRQSPSSC